MKFEEHNHVNLCILQEASYEPSPHTLPSTLGTEQEVLLLTVHLSGNGEIILHRGKTNKSVDTGKLYV